MKGRKAYEAAARLAKPYRITRGRGFRLRDFDPADTGSLEDREQAGQALAEGIQLLSELQEKLYAQNRWSVLLIFQAMDAAGKDSTIEHVMSGVNPQGVEVHSFKAPTHHELDHDYLWRSICRLPERGRIGIHNRSYYEEALVVRVHPELLAHEQLPAGLVTKKIWSERYHDIHAFEDYLARNGVLVRKFFLHVSKAEQKRRFLARLDEPAKNWKFAAADVEERRHWKHYMRAYEDVIRATASERAPWYVVPADHKWFTRLVVAAAIVDSLAGLDLAFPTIDPEKRRELAIARRELLGEG